MVREYLATHKLSWADHFKSFAVEDLNRYLSPESNAAPVRPRTVRRP